MTYALKLGVHQYVKYVILQPGFYLSRCIWTKKLEVFQDAESAMWWWIKGDNMQKERLRGGGVNVEGV